MMEISPGAEGVGLAEGDTQQAQATLTSLANIITGMGAEHGADEQRAFGVDRQPMHQRHVGAQQEELLLQDQGEQGTAEASERARKRVKTESHVEQHHGDEAQQEHEGEGAHVHTAEGLDYNMQAAAAAAIAAATASGSGGLTIDAIGSSGFTAEQLAALQTMPMLTPEMVAAALQPAPGSEGQVQLPVLSDMPHFLDPAALGVPGMDMLQSLSPDQLQAFLANSAQFFLPTGFPMAGGSGGPGVGSESNPITYKNWWDEKDEQELMRIVNDKDYRMEKLGADEMDWAKLETYFNRSQNALRKKYWMLSKGRDAGGGGGGASAPPTQLPAVGVEQEALDAAAAHAAQLVAASAPAMTQVGQPSPHPRSRAPRKKWTDVESRDVERIVMDATYRLEQGLQDCEADEVSFERLAIRFGCSLQTAKRKYRHLQEQATQGGGTIPEKGKRQHFRKSVPYRWMIVSALSKIAGFESTAPQIFENIEADPELRSQLDMRIMPGTKHVPRWKIQVRKVLSADHIFINTGVKQKHETIWRLDPVALQEANADRQRQRAGVPPIALGSGEHVMPAAPALGGGAGAGSAGDMSAMALQLNEGALAMLHQQQVQQLMSLQQHQMQLGDAAGSGHIQHVLGGLEGMDPAMAAAVAAAAAAGMAEEGGQGGEGGEQGREQDQQYQDQQYQSGQQQQQQHPHHQQYQDQQYQPLSDEQQQQLLEQHQQLLEQHQQQQLAAQHMQMQADEQEQQQLEQHAAEVAAWQEQMAQHNAAIERGEMAHPHHQQAMAEEGAIPHSEA